MSHTRIPDGDTVPTRPPKKHHRVFWGIFLTLQAVFLIWVITGATTVAGTGGSCGSLSHSDCVAAHEAGGTIGMGLLIGLWVAVDVIVGGSYAIYRLARRP